jgi:hypothetical protein
VEVGTKERDNREAVASIERFRRGEQLLSARGQRLRRRLVCEQFDTPVDPAVIRGAYPRTRDEVAADNRVNRAGPLAYRQR